MTDQAASTKARHFLIRTTPISPGQEGTRDYLGRMFEPGGSLALVPLWVCEPVRARVFEDIGEALMFRDWFTVDALAGGRSCSFSVESYPKDSAWFIKDATVDVLWKELVSTKEVRDRLAKTIEALQRDLLRVVDEKKVLANENADLKIRAECERKALVAERDDNKDNRERVDFTAKALARANHDNDTMRRELATKAADASQSRAEARLSKQKLVALIAGVAPLLNITDATEMSDLRAIIEQLQLAITRVVQ